MTSDRVSWSRFFAISSAILWVLGCFCGCASMGPFRADNPTPLRNGYHVAFVEFDEQGWFSAAGRSQLSAAEQLIVQQSGLATSSPRGIILLAFVHGWKHNAAEGDANVKSFEELLKKIADRESNLDESLRHPVVGVYLGWPGLHAKVEPFKTLGFYSRKNTADKVGYYGGVTETLLRLRNLNSAINGKKGQRPRSYMVTAGHSFGGQVVFNALAHNLNESLVNSRIRLELQLQGNAPLAGERLTTDHVIKPFGDIIVLVNPAFEASRYYDLKTLSETFNYIGEQRPIVGIFSSADDKATKIWFPIGRSLSTIFERYQRGELGALQRRANTQTVPWVDEWVTHKLELEKKNGRPNATSNNFLSVRSEITADVAKIEAVINNWDEETRKQPLHLGGSVLTPLRPHEPWTSFYVTQVYDKIVDEHGGIWSDDFSRFISNFILASIREDSRAAPRAAKR